VDVHASAGVWAPWPLSYKPRQFFFATINQGSFATADSNVPISKIKSMIIGSYGNSDGNPSIGSTSTTNDDFIVPSETTSKSN
jgi:hypothetical protein